MAFADRGREHLIQCHLHHRRHRLRVHELPVVVAPAGRFGERPADGDGHRFGREAEQDGVLRERALHGGGDRGRIRFGGQPVDRAVDRFECAVGFEEEVPGEVEVGDRAVDDVEVDYDELSAGDLVFTVHASSLCPPRCAATRQRMRSAARDAGVEPDGQVGHHLGAVGLVEDLVARIRVDDRRHIRQPRTLAVRPLEAPHAAFAADRVAAAHLEQQRQVAGEVACGSPDDAQRVGGAEQLRERHGCGQRVVDETLRDLGVAAQPLHAGRAEVGVPLVEVSAVQVAGQPVGAAGEHGQVVVGGVAVEDHLHHERSPAVPEDREREVRVLVADDPAELVHGRDGRTQAAVAEVAEPGGVAIPLLPCRCGRGRGGRRRRPRSRRR